MTTHDTAADEARRLCARFEAQGAEVFDTDILQPADILLDLYGEDIRARAYVTQDPLRGERMLRPDFTVPLVQAHMAYVKSPARYTYAGKVFRRQEVDPERQTEFYQAGFEIFGGNPAEADAEVFATISDALSGLPVNPVVGDLGVLLAAVEGLQASETRKAALRRHIWRPNRFRALLDRYAGRTTMSDNRAELLAKVAAGADVLADAGPEIGKRSASEVMGRLERLVREFEEPPISEVEVERLDKLLSLNGSVAEVADELKPLADGVPALEAAADRFLDRIRALENLGVDTSSLPFQGSHGRTTLEYYDGFVFSFGTESQKDGPAIASGGRYDALTRVLGHGQSLPAVGAVIRPDLVLLLRGAA